MEIVQFTDETLYNPTAWTWEFTPSTVAFVDGTSMNSQNPKVVFEEPGIYSVKLTATNANGSANKTIENMITVDGVAVNYSEDFETGTSGSFVISHNERGKIKIDTRAAAPGSSYGVHFQGYHMTGGWTGGPANTTPDQAWNVNTAFHSFLESCAVDATGIAGVGLELDLRQTYSIGNKYSWFRVLVDGTPVTDMNGVENFNPVTNTDPFTTVKYDLSAHGNSIFKLTLNASCYLSDKFFAEGDNVFVDNIMISNITGIDGTDAPAGVLTYPNPARSLLNYSANGTGSNITVKVLNLQGQTISEEAISGYRDGDVRQVSTAHLGSGIYILNITGDKGTTVKKFIVE